MEVAFDVSNDILRSIAHEGPKLYIRTTLIKEAVSSDTGDTAFDHTGVLVLVEKRF
jgi:hypothetical protein